MPVMPVIRTLKVASSKKLSAFSYQRSGETRWNHR